MLLGQRAQKDEQPSEQTRLSELVVAAHVDPGGADHVGEGMRELVPGLRRQARNRGINHRLRHVPQSRGDGRVRELYARELQAVAGHHEHAAVPTYGLGLPHQPGLTYARLPDQEGQRRPAPSASSNAAFSVSISGSRPTSWGLEIDIGRAGAVFGRYPDCGPMLTGSDSEMS